MLKLFYADYCEGKSVDSADPVERTVPDILHSMDCVLHEPGNFLGIVFADDSTLQFMVNEDGSILIDVPAPTERGSYSRSASLAECLSIVGEITANFRATEIDGLSFQPW